MIDPGVYERNRAALPPYLREIADREAERAPEEATVRIVGRLPEQPVALVRTEGGEVHSNSLSDPLGEAEMWADTLAYKDMRISFIYGCGFGYPLLSYRKRKKPYTETFIFEQNCELFCAMLRCVDIRPLLQDPLVHFIVGDLLQMKQQLSVYISGDFLYRCASFTATFTWLAHRNEKRTYLALHESLWSLLGLLTASLGNTVHDSLVGLYNTLDNVDAVMTGPGLSSLRGSFAGKPAIIVSNGPSLDRNLEVLTGVVDRALVLSTASALSACLRKGIQPDAVCVTERSPSVYRLLFEEERIADGTMLIGLSVIDPRIPASFTAPWLPVFRNGELSCKWVREAITKDQAGLHGGISSAHLAFEFALWTGANPIIFVGQDLAFGPDRQTHSQFSIYTEAKMSKLVRQLQAEPQLLVQGVNGETIPTTKLWLDFKLWFEHQISRYGGTRLFINATESGARIEGTREMSLQATVDEFCSDGLPCSLLAYVRNLPASEQHMSASKAYGTLLHEVNGWLEDLQLLVKSANHDSSSLRLLELACKIHGEYPDTDMPLFAQPLIEKLEYLYKKYTDNEKLVTFIQHIVFAFQRRIVELGEVDSIDKLSEWVRLQKQMSDYLQKTCQLLITELQIVKHNLQQRYSVHLLK